MVFEDAFKWFIDRFGAGSTKEEEKLDVIIMDALDPDKLIEIMGSLYKDNHFVESLFEGLTNEGVVSSFCFRDKRVRFEFASRVVVLILDRFGSVLQFVIQLGEADSSADAATETGPFVDSAHMVS